MIKSSYVNQNSYLSTKVVLLIDDEQPVREAVKDILELIDVDVITAVNGRDGIALYTQQQKEINLILLDLSMPGMNGAETLRALRQIDPHIPILLSSGYSKTEIVSRFIDTNLTDFLQKPYSLDALIDTVQKYLA